MAEQRGAQVEDGVARERAHGHRNDADRDVGTEAPALQEAAAYEGPELPFGEPSRAYLGGGEAAALTLRAHDEMTQN
jgi:hypothetical protein